MARVSGSRGEGGGGRMKVESEEKGEKGDCME